MQGVRFLFALSAFLPLSLLIGADSLPRFSAVEPDESTEDFPNRSRIPAGLEAAFDHQGMADLLSYLSSLK